MNVKMQYEDEVSRIEGGVRAVEEGGKLVVFDAEGKVIAKRDLSRVSDWWPEASPLETKKARIDQAVRAVEEGLSPDVIRIRYSIGTDWSEEPAIYFRVILSDDAAAQRLQKVTKEVRERLDGRVDFGALGLRPYHHFRSESEQASLRDQAWE